MSYNHGPGWVGKWDGVWDVAYDEALDSQHFDPAYEDSSERSDRAGYFAEGAEWGAGWMAAIIGMAQAIRDQQPSHCDGCGTWVDESKGKFCYTCLREPNVQTIRIRL